MIANYHTHTWRCNHASGTEREYVEHAIMNGMKTLGFSDHTPQFFDDDHYPDNEKMRPDKLEGYVDTVLGLKKEYASDIKILLGLEVEYYPASHERLKNFLAPYPFDYFLLGQHYLMNGNLGEPNVFRPTVSETLLKQYVDQCIDALETGEFLYMAHPDVLHFVGDNDIYQREMERLCIKARELHIPLEINLLGLGGGRYYPNPLFWDVAAKTGNHAVLGADAHNVQNVYNEPIISLAGKMAEKKGLKILPELL